MSAKLPQQSRLGNCRRQIWIKIVTVLKSIITHPFPVARDNPWGLSPGPKDRPATHTKQVWGFLKRWPESLPVLSIHSTAEDVCTELRTKWHEDSNPSLFWLLSISQQFQWICFMTGHLVSESKWAVQHILYTVFIEFGSGWFSYQRRFV